MPVVAWLDEMGHFMHHDVFQTLLRLFRQLRIQPDVSSQRVAAALKNAKRHDRSIAVLERSAASAAQLPYLLTDIFVNGYLVCLGLSSLCIPLPVQELDTIL